MSEYETHDELLMPLDISEDLDPNALLLKAVEQNDLHTLYQLIEQGISPNFNFVKYNGKETTPLQEAIARGHEEMILLIVQTDIKTINALSLFIAITAQDGNFSRKTVKFLLSHGARISYEQIKKIRDLTCLQYTAVEAVNTDRVDILKLFISADISLDFQVDDYLDLKTSPLDRAINDNKLTIVRFLLKDAKVDPNQPINGFSYLLQAIDMKKFELVSLLLQYGAIFNE
ncbi:ankyrin repeat domain-containing protein [Thiotrichales bacterium 19S11-10]|nr:ankyrin repeat domain-containing protein [Thiotrichales bacterium 19S11-10]